MTVGGRPANASLELPAPISAASSSWTIFTTCWPGVRLFRTSCPSARSRTCATNFEAVERWGLGEEALHRFTTPLSCAVRGDLKLLRRGEREELYDLRSDPLEVAPLPAGSAPAGRDDELRALRAALEHPSMTTVRAGQDSAAAAGAPTAEELSEIEERMKLLGYM